MSAAQSVRAAWLAAATLNARLPLDRVFTGAAPPGTVLPAASLEILAERNEAAPTGSAVLDTVALRITVRAETLAEALELRTLQDQMLSAAEFAALPEIVLAAERLGGGQTSTSANHWSAYSDWEFLIQRDRS